MTKERDRGKWTKVSLNDSDFCHRVRRHLMLMFCRKLWMVTQPNIRIRLESPIISYHTTSVLKPSTPGLVRTVSLIRNDLVTHLPGRRSTRLIEVSRRFSVKKFSNFFPFPENYNWYSYEILNITADSL